MFLNRLLLAALLVLFAFAVGAEEAAAPKKPISFEEAMAEDGSQPSSEPATFQPVEPETPADQPAPEAGQSPAEKAPAADPTSKKPLPPSVEEEFTAPDGQTGQLEMAPSEKPQRKIRLPSGGLTMEEVESSFGTPENKLPAVGEPPITRWIYRDYTVYFEHKRVVHSVYNDPRDSQP